MKSPPLQWRDSRRIGKEHVGTGRGERLGQNSPAHCTPFVLLLFVYELISRLGLNSGAGLLQAGVQSPQYSL